ncbi:hypothetical protein SPBR_02308 [Sporothrix brasiliensis 5110]|uniref:Uncharacterized protein n=1 Tax=Sporothrix brasiliensis 5110 TaxID=1398154 RepID=A0A0C2J6A1_9PEZI|nr:uncharacterized protein SPBR_02308 [Sporothrix brasiliensis 5110]KIH92572.1 hypothetical protein SPBR_02308 [Sporothrix brasiliensis 5110]
MATAEDSWRLPNATPITPPSSHPSTNSVADRPVHTRPVVCSVAVLRSLSRLVRLVRLVLLVRASQYAVAAIGAGDDRLDDPASDPGPPDQKPPVHLDELDQRALVDLSFAARLDQRPLGVLDTHRVHRALEVVLQVDAVAVHNQAGRPAARAGRMTAAAAAQAIGRRQGGVAVDAVALQCRCTCVGGRSAACRTIAIGDNAASREAARRIAAGRHAVTHLRRVVDPGCQRRRADRLRHARIHQHGLPRRSLALRQQVQPRQHVLVDPIDGLFALDLGHRVKEHLARHGRRRKGLHRVVRRQSTRHGTLRNQREPAHLLVPGVHVAERRRQAVAKPLLQRHEPVLLRLRQIAQAVAVGRREHAHLVDVLADSLACDDVVEVLLGEEHVGRQQRVALDNRAARHAAGLRQCHEWLQQRDVLQVLVNQAAGGHVQRDGSDRATGLRLGVTEVHRRIVLSHNRKRSRTRHLASLAKHLPKDLLLLLKQLLHSVEGVNSAGVSVVAAAGAVLEAEPLFFVVLFVVLFAVSAVEVLAAASAAAAAAFSLASSFFLAADDCLARSFVSFASFASVCFDSFCSFGTLAEAAVSVEDSAAGVAAGAATTGVGAGFSFFCFFLRPMIGAISTASSSCSFSAWPANEVLVVVAASTTAAASIFNACLRCLRCWLLVVLRTAAEPMRVGCGGGGDPAREAEIDADTTDALSETDTTSLTGVLGRFDTDACRLARTADVRAGVDDDDDDAAVDAAASLAFSAAVIAVRLKTGAGPDSVLAGCTTRSVLGGAARTAGDQGAAGVGNEGNADAMSAVVFLSLTAGLASAAFAAAGLAVAARFKTAGTGFLSLDFFPTGVDGFDARTCETGAAAADLVADAAAASRAGKSSS